MATSERRSPLLTSEEKIARDVIARQEAEETKECQAITNNSVLTEDEYKKADQEFKRFIVKPRSDGDPIYIMPELDEKGQLHPLLKKIVEGIKSGDPYEKFITESWGTIWPLLLRLYYGLQSKGYEGFKISINQVISIMNLCYWRALGLEVRYEPFFNKDGSLSPAGIWLTHRSMLQFPEPNSSQKREKFIEQMRNPRIPNGERCVLVIKLNAEYLRIILGAYLQRSGEENKPLSKAEEAYFEYDKLYNVEKAGVFSVEKVAKSTELRGAKMLAATMRAGNDFYKIVTTDEDKEPSVPALMFPTLSILKLYHQTANPTRQNFEMVYVLGHISVKLFEFYCGRNQRVENLIVPGVKTNPIMQHNKLVTPASALMHGFYHFNQEGLISEAVYLQMTHAKAVLRNIFKGLDETSSEIFRCCDREGEPLLNEHDKLFNLLKIVFSQSLVIKDSPRFFSSVLILIDMILSPEHWPFYPFMKEKYIDLLLPCTGKKPDKYVEFVEKAIRKYSADAKQDNALTALLLLCHFYLKDTKLCTALVTAVNKKSTATPLFAWRKKENKNLYPVLILNGEDYTLEKLANIPSEKRLALLEETITKPPVAEVKTSDSAIELAKKFRFRSAGKDEPEDKDKDFRVLTQNVLKAEVFLDPSSNGNTALHWALINEQFERAQIILEEEAKHLGKDNPSKILSIRNKDKDKNKQLPADIVAGKKLPEELAKLLGITVKPSAAVTSHHGKI